MSLIVASLLYNFCSEISFFFVDSFLKTYHFLESEKEKKDDLYSGGLDGERKKDTHYSLNETPSTTSLFAAPSSSAASSSLIICALCDRDISNERISKIKKKSFCSSCGERMVRVSREKGLIVQMIRE